MKRLNPETNLPFKMGEYNPETGLYFRTYTGKLNKNGLFKESWLTEDALNRFRGAQKKSAERWQKERHKENKSFVDSYKVDAGCCNCGFNSHPSALDFDHIDRNKKSFNISEKYGALTLDKIKSEIMKCRVICANCHRIKSYEMNEHKKIKPPKNKMTGIIDSRLKKDKNRSVILTNSNKSMMKGVYLSKNGIYFVRMQKNGKRVCCGSFDNAFDAACAVMSYINRSKLIEVEAS